MIYRNRLALLDDLEGWVVEGPMAAAAGHDGVELYSSADESEEGDHAHFTLWCPEELPDRIRISWSFQPLTDAGLAMAFFGAAGIGHDLFSPALAPRDGFYPQYHSSDIRTLHVSYYRRKWASERRFLTCNLRKSPGFELVAQGADPLPALADVDGYYRIAVEKDGPDVRFSIDDLPVFTWRDTSPADSRVSAGRFGFRQMAPLRARYRNLEVTELHD